MTPSSYAKCCTVVSLIRLAHQFELHYIIDSENGESRRCVRVTGTSAPGLAGEIVNSHIIQQDQVSKCLDQCSHIRPKPMLACRPKRLALADDKGDAIKGPEENALPYSVPHTKGTTSIVVIPARNAGDATLLHHQNPIYS
ncbi:unnamed protein product [Hymenolepis diminuta]|uniref:Uncharacterized protein n=1 Tax=Hymenolepis diminuta TaxID=6216 RepID=A0A564YQH7_HYMDI|nr:unnamed protein product [Hymenolepis diminuta]